MHPSRPGSHAYGSFQAGTQELSKNEKIKIDRTASNDTESIQIAPRDYRGLNFVQIPDFSFFMKFTKFDAD